MNHHYRHTCGLSDMGAHWQISFASQAVEMLVKKGI
jgi:hypothetical protein